MSQLEQKSHHRVRTYVRRESRITRAQQRALNEDAPRYLIAADEIPLDFEQIFPQASKYALELGFGSGESLVHLAATYPDRGFLGVEVYRPGVGKCLLNLKRHDLRNVRLLTADARDVMEKMIRPKSLDSIYILFPDPWPKKRHRKRRLITSQFIDSCANCLADSGRLNVATDCEDYAEQILLGLNRHAGFVNANSRGGFYSGPLIRGRTVYEAKALDKGSCIFEILFRRRQ